MYELFIKENMVSHEKIVDRKKVLNNIEANLKSFFVECGGFSFRMGLYRTYTMSTSIHWSIIINNYFPKYEGKILPFGYDWMGRQFCINASKKNCIQMFDCATAEDFELNQDLLSFHNQELVYERETVLYENNFEKAIKFLGVKEINYKDCVGYKIPLFLNGKDSLDNYEITNLEVYWEMQFQIFNQVKDLPPDTKIDSFNMQ